MYYYFIYCFVLSSEGAFNRESGSSKLPKSILNLRSGPSPFSYNLFWEAFTRKEAFITVDHLRYIYVCAQSFLFENGDLQVNTCCLNVFSRTTGRSASIFEFSTSTKGDRKPYFVRNLGAYSVVVTTKFSKKPPFPSVPINRRKAKSFKNS